MVDPNIMLLRQKYKHSSKVLTSSISKRSKHSIKASNKHIHHTHHANACSYECMPYLAASQHLCINAYLYHMHVHGKTTKLEDKTLI